MDQIVQQNAANAEDTSPSEVMSTEALQIRDFVADLVMLVGERQWINGATSTKQEKHKTPSGNITDRNWQATADDTNQKSKGKLISPAAEETHSCKLIPFDEF